MTINNQGGGGLVSSIIRERQHQQSPMLSNIESGIFMAITTGQPDPEGRGRLSAYVPKFGGTPEEPMFFQYAAPFGGSNGSGSYGMFATPPDAGVTVMVFFADNGDISRGYWFAVAQEIPDVAAGGAAGPPAVDGTGQGEGVFSDSPAAKSNPTSVNAQQNPDANDPRGTDQRGQTQEPNQQPYTQADIDSVEELRSLSTDIGGGGRTTLTAGERAYAIEKGYIRGGPLDAFGGAGAEVGGAPAAPANPDATDPRGSNQIPNHPRNANTAGQGVYTDSIRGHTTASPVRDASYENQQHSRVYGLKTPGSNALTMDDGSVSPDGTVHPNQIRLQTGSGASIILDGTNDTIYMINSSGSGWVEIGAGGEIMAYAQGSISMRAEKDFNIRADKNVNIEAGQHINMKAGENFKVNTGNQVHLKSDGSQFFDSGGSNHTKVKTNMYVSTGSLLHLNGPQAAMSVGITTVSHSDIQNLESTQVNESIMSGMPSHEPMARQNVPPSQGATPGSPSSDVSQNPNGAEGQLDGASTDEVIDDGQGGSIIYRNQGATRRLKVVPALERILLSAANATNTHVIIFSGGQDHTTGTVGSNRHDHGYAADIWIYRDSSHSDRLSMVRDTQEASLFAKAARQAGAKSIGAGSGYMDNVGMHVDIAPGATVANGSATYWGSGGRSANAPAWVRSVMT